MIRRVRTHAFEDGNLVSTSAWPPSLWHYEAELVVSLNPPRILKDRYAARTEQPDRALIRLYEAIEAGEKVLVLT